MLLGDPLWNMRANHGKSASGLLFESEAAGADGGAQSNAPYGYVVGVFAPRHDPDPASCITVWVRMATTAPYLRVRWTPGVRLADVDGYDARAELLGMNSGHDRHPSSEGSRPHRSGVNQTLSSPELLRRAGVSEGTLRDLGLARSPYVGIVGAIDVNGLPLGAALPGPVRLRATGHDPLDARVNDGARALWLVENLQAAETACDMFPDVAVIWFAGQPADAVLAVCVSAARQTSGPILVAPDADLGGVRIANRLLAALPSRSRVHVVDAGVGTTAPTMVFSNVSLDELDRIGRDADGPHASHLSAFARAVADRGYPVEQEASIRAALSIALLPGE
ncbi:hypothetical protein [Cellulomonas hominis]